MEKYPLKGNSTIRLSGPASYQSVTKKVSKADA